MNLSSKHLKAVSMLAAGRTGCEVANELNVTPQTVSGWKKIPEVAAEINRLRGEVLNSTRAKLEQACMAATDTLLELTRHGNSEEVRRKAAVDILRLGGFEPSALHTFGAGIGPSTAEEIREQQDRHEAIRALAAETVRLVSQATYTSSN